VIANSSAVGDVEDKRPNSNEGPIQDLAPASPGEGSGWPPGRVGDPQRRVGASSPGVVERVPRQRPDHLDAARAFVDALRRPDGRAILERYGFFFANANALVKRGDTICTVRNGAWISDTVLTQRRRQLAQRNLDECAAEREARKGIPGL